MPALLLGSGRGIALRLMPPGNAADWPAGAVTGAGLCAHTPIAVRRIAITARSFTVISLPSCPHPCCGMLESDTPQNYEVKGTYCHCAPSSIPQQGCGHEGSEMTVKLLAV